MMQKPKSLTSVGFSSAKDYAEQKLDLNKKLIHHPAATFFVRASGESMKEAGIFSNDILIVDRAIEAKHNNIAVVVLNGEILVRRLCLNGESVTLKTANMQSSVEIEEGDDFSIWGVVTYVIHKT